MATKDEKAQIAALLEEAGQPTDNYSTGFVNALLLAQGVVEDKEEVFQHACDLESNAVADEGSIHYALDQMFDGKKVRRKCWDDGKMMTFERGQFYISCPERGREKHCGMFNTDELNASDWVLIVDKRSG